MVSGGRRACFLWGTVGPWDRVGRVRLAADRSISVKVGLPVHSRLGVLISCWPMHGYWEASDDIMEL